MTDPGSRAFTADHPHPAVNVSPDLLPELGAELATPAPDPNAEFTAWLAQVDRLVEYVGVTRADLDDYPYRQAFDEGCGAAVVARQAIRASW